MAAAVGVILFSFYSRLTIRFYLVNQHYPNQLCKPTARPLDIEYFKYSILSNRVFNTVFNTFFRNVNIDIGYSILFGAGIDIEYSLL